MKAKMIKEATNRQSNSSTQETNFIRSTTKIDFSVIRESPLFPCPKCRTRKLAINKNKQSVTTGLRNKSR